MTSQTYQFVFCYTNKIVLSYSSQIETYIGDILCFYLGISNTQPKMYEPIFDNYCVGTKLFVSSGNNLSDLPNVSVDRTRVKSNCLDFIQLKSNGWFKKQPILPIPSFVENFSQHVPAGDLLYTFNVFLPISLIKTTNMSDASDASDASDTPTVIWSPNSPPYNQNDNNETYIGSVFLLIHKSKTIKEFVTCVGYNEFLSELKNLE